MKFPISHFPFPIGHARRGMALIITLILLSVTLIMAVAFLAIARRERNAVTTTTDTAIARLATDSALAAATAQMAANIFATTNLAAYDSHLLVSTNYINSLGFATGSASPTNVNYSFYPNGNPLNAGDYVQNIANLWLLPRAPVFVPTNNGNGYDFRFYLDLNQNRKFETNGVIQEFDSLGNAIGNPFLHVGDPEWIGVLERPDQPHGPNNHFVARYAFLAQPIGNSLDLNYIHNEANSRAVDQFAGQSGVLDGFYRNQGVGSWELNLASFLADLDTNIWGQVVGSGNGAPFGAGGFYLYNTALTGFNNQGIAFDDALSLLSWRYNYSYNNLLSASQIFGIPSAFQSDSIDGYSDGQLQTTVDTNADFVADVPSRSWAGADNPNRFFSLPSELFDPTKSSANFYNRLWSAGTSNATYDRYTFYRLLDQLGTGSTADDTRLNLNYRNVTNGVVQPGLETNLLRWTAVEFFTNAADRLLQAYTANWRADNYFNYTNTFGASTTNAFGVTGIPVYVNGQFVYTPAVNRLLQLAANIYDATTNSPFPSVFRPVFSVTNVNGYRNIYISGYSEVSALPSLTIGLAPLDTPVDITASALAVNATATTPQGNVFGVPWILGAKKGLPNFNLLSTVNTAQVTRKLMVSRNTTNITASTIYWTNQMYVVGITNNMTVSFWNSYETSYPRPLKIYALDSVFMQLTNNNGPLLTIATNFFISPTVINLWPGSQWSASFAPPNSTPQANSFYSANWSFPFISDSVYRFAPPPSQTHFDPVGSPTGSQWETTTPPLPPLPQMGLLTTNWFHAVILDGNHVIDYVQLRGPNSGMNLSASLADANYPDASNRRLQWSTNQPTSTSPTWGVLNQLTVSANANLAPAGNKWVRPPTMPIAVGSTPTEEAGFFGGFFTPFWFDSIKGKNYVNIATNVQAPYTPTRVVYNYTLWQPNDPLVHYLASDLNFVDPGTMGLHTSDQPKVPSTTDYATQLGDRYQPWGRGNQIAKIANTDTNVFSLKYRDPLVWGSDNWDFPTNPLPTVGWLGRVHRGTPWQTVYLKAHNILHVPDLVGPGTGTNTWTAWVGEDNNVFDAANSAPLQDRLLFDLFTTRFNDNAARGALSVNQTHLAAWSSVFSGLVVLSNNLPDISTLPGQPANTASWIIDPAGPGGDTSVLGQMVNGIGGTNLLGINAARQTFTNADGLVGAFEHVGDILSVPALTETSPFLNTSTASQIQYGISDELYEWLPQQTLGLLRVDDTPRFVVYCFGQTLKPARDSLVLSGGSFFGLCTNYQVTAESAARAVVRLDRRITVDNTGKATGTNYTPVVESYNPLPPQ